VKREARIEAERGGREQFKREQLKRDGLERDDDGGG
jgi:hypothetical protein